jgi:D-alanyl-D-alanine dipeptidase
MVKPVTTEAADRIELKQETLLAYDTVRPERRGSRGTANIAHSAGPAGNWERRTVSCPGGHTGAPQAETGSAVQMRRARN